jgi:uncharacterized protein (TIGR01777 family)
MKSVKFSIRTLIKADKDAIYQWHLQKASFSRSFPPWEKASILSIEDLPGRQVRVNVSFERFFKKVKATFRVHYPIGSQTIRVKEECGSIKSLDFQIEIKHLGENLYELVEKVEYKLAYPFWFESLRKKRFEKRLRRLFEYKHEVMNRDLTYMKDVKEPLKILLSGSNGLIGSALKEFLEILGHDVYRLVRKKREVRSSKDIFYSLETGEVDRSQLENFDSVVHLTGKSIQSSWNKKNKKEILESRYEATKLLAKVLASLQRPPKSFLCASAVGIYGDQKESLLNEDSIERGEGFLANVCLLWESASEFLKLHGVRVVHLRFGLVLSTKGGILSEVIKFFKMGFGPIFGTGKQYYSWIAIDDAVLSIYHLIKNKEIEGAVNICSPNPVTNYEFMKKISLRLNKSLGPNLSKAFLQLVKGDAANELLLSSTRVLPKKLIESGYAFYYPTLEATIDHLLL